jgi:hypothetical protein
MGDSFNHRTDRKTRLLNAIDTKVEHILEDADELSAMHDELLDHPGVHVSSAPVLRSKVAYHKEFFEGFMELHPALFGGELLLSHDYRHSGIRSFADLVQKSGDPSTMIIPTDVHVPEGYFLSTGYNVLYLPRAVCDSHLVAFGFGSTVVGSYFRFGSGTPADLALGGLFIGVGLVAGTLAIQPHINYIIDPHKKAAEKLDALADYLDGASERIAAMPTGVFEHGDL